MLTNWLEAETGMVPIAAPVVGWVKEVTVPSLQALETAETCTEPPAPSVFTNKIRLTFEIEVTLVPAGSVARLNLINARVTPAPDVAPTCSSGAEPKLTAGKAVLTFASSVGEMVCPSMAPGKIKARTIRPARSFAEEESMII